MNKRTSFIVAVIMIALAAFSRLIPHPVNFAPITAIALFGGVYFNGKFSPIVPLAALLISDYFLGFYDGIVWVYGSFLLVVVIGLAIRRYKSVPVIFGATIVSSLLFFLITNFGVWQAGVFYTKDFTGLVECYAAAIPFYRNAAIGDLFYGTVLFGVYELVMKYLPKVQSTKA
ncbi:MAG TPA: hypothetical protein DCQ28_12165 [Bacteroidetes bacterium]|nr:hypothetical protein [Bacteroidota bacterium]